MRNRQSLYTGLAITIALTLAVAAAAATRMHPFRSKRADGFQRSQPFTLGGEFTGTLGGEIVLNGLSYRLDPNAFIFEIGHGVVPVGTDVEDRFVTVSGLTTKSGTTVYSVIVRPAGEATFQSDDMSSKVHVREAGAPR